MGSVNWLVGVLLVWAVLVLGGLNLITPDAMAEDGAKSAIASVPVERTSESFLVFTIKSLGWFFFPVFLLLSIISVSLVTMNIMTIRRSVLVPPDLRAQFELLLEEKKFQEAWALTQANDSYLARILAAGLTQAKNGYDATMKRMQDVGEEETMRYEQRLNHLALIAGIAPMLGLLGTVVGMVYAFQVIAVSATAPQASKLAEGISTALITTEVGLIMAIPCIICYELLKGYLARIVLEAAIISEAIFAKMKK